MRRLPLKLILTSVLVFGQVSIDISPVSALLFASNSNPAALAISSAKWGLIPSNTLITPAAGTVLVINNPSKTPPSYFHLDNIGTIDVLTFGLSVSYSGLPGANSFQIKSCSTTWNQTTHLCPAGTITTVLDSSGGTSPISQNGIAKAIATGSQSAFQIVVSKNNATLNITAIVHRSDLRAAVTTNS